MPSRTLKTPKTNAVSDSVLDALSDMFGNVRTTENQTNTDKKRRISSRQLKGVKEPVRFKPENPKERKKKKPNGTSSSRSSRRLARSALRATRLSPQEDKPTSPQAARTSPQAARTSPQAARTSPQAARTSPQAAITSAQVATTSPQAARISPRGNSRRFVQVRRIAATQAQGAALISEIKRMQLEIRSLTNRINDLALQDPASAKRLLNRNVMTPSGLYTRINADMREAPPKKLQKPDE